MASVATAPRYSAEDFETMSIRSAAPSYSESWLAFYFVLEVHLLRLSRGGPPTFPPTTGCGRNAQQHASSSPRETGLLTEHAD